MARTWVALNNSPPFEVDAMMLLTDGTVVVQEQAGPGRQRLTPDAAGSYVNGSWADLENGPGYLPYSSAVLADGRVLSARGDDNSGYATIYDPVKDDSTEIPAPGWSWLGASPACVLPDGRVIMGSVDDTRTAIYDPTANRWSDGPAKNDASRNETWTLLPDGSVLCADVQAHPHAEKYVPSANAWVSAGSIPAANDLVLQTTEDLLTGPAVLMPDGRVFAIGASGHTAVYTPAPDPAGPGSWAAGPDFPACDSGQPWGAPSAPAVLLPNGRVLCIAGSVRGFGYAGEPCHAFEFDGTALTLAPDPPYANDVWTWQYRLLLLPTGEVLCATGREDRGRSLHVYRPDGEPDPAWAPVIVSAASIVRAGETFMLQGQQLNGLSQAQSDGTRAQTANNFPLARIKSGARVYYCPTHGFSTMGVATGAAVVSTEVDVPGEIPAGAAQLSVVANGIAASSPIEVAPPAAWQADAPGFVPGAIAAAGDPSGYAFEAQATQHVVYRDHDDHIRELRWDTDGWHTSDLTRATNAAAAAGDPAGYIFGGTQHVVYRTADHHIHELWRDTSGWHTHDLTKATAAARAAGDPAGYAFDAQATQHVLYRGTDLHIHELWWDTSGWHTSDLTTTTHAATAAGDPAGYVFEAQATQHVVYRGTDHHIHQLWWDTDGWHTSDLTKATRAAAAAGDPAGYVFGADGGTQHVVYRAADDHIHQLWWDTNGWHTSDLSAATGPVPAIGDPIAITQATPAIGDPSGYAFDAHGGSQHVLYRGIDDMIRELRWG
jgi:Fungal fucose-specific lectin